VQRIAGAERFARFDIQVAAELARQLIAQPEGEGIGFAILIALGVVQEREVQVIDFALLTPLPVSRIRKVRRSSADSSMLTSRVILPICVVVTAY
jgi:hypothetical protein